LRTPARQCVCVSAKEARGKTAIRLGDQPYPDCVWHGLYTSPLAASLTSDDKKKGFVAMADMIVYEFAGFLFWPEIDALQTPAGRQLSSLMALEACFMSS